MIFPELYPCINYRILAFYAPIPVQIHGNSIIPLYHIQGNFEYRGILLYNVRIVHWSNDAMVTIHRSGLMWYMYSTKPINIISMKVEQRPFGTKISKHLQENRHDNIISSTKSPFCDEALAKNLGNEDVSLSAILNLDRHR